METLKAKLTAGRDAIMTSAELTGDWVVEKWGDTDFLSRLSSVFLILSLLSFIAASVILWDPEQVSRGRVAFLFSLAFILINLGAITNTRFWVKMCESYKEIIGLYKNMVDDYDEVVDQQVNIIRNLTSRVVQDRLDEIVREANKQVSEESDDEIHA